MNSDGVSIIAPCFNEEANIKIFEQRLRRSLSKAKINYELIFIDDASTDSTLENLLSFNNSEIKIISNKNNLGIFESWRKGLTLAAYDNVCLIDTDLQNPPEDITKLFGTMTSLKAKIVQATRSDFERAKNLRYVYSRILNHVLNMSFNDDAKDNKSGFIICKKEVLSSALDSISELKLYYPQTFIRVALKQSNYGIIEIESHFMPRISGKSFLNKVDLITSVFKILLSDLPKVFINFQKTKSKTVPELIPENFLTNKSLKIETLNFSQKFLKNIYFCTMPVHKWIIKKSSKIYYEQLFNSQYFSREELVRLQNTRLIALLRHVDENVPYYSKLFKDKGIEIDMIKSKEDLKLIPMLSKEDVKNNLYFELFASNINKNKLLKISTSGSTGEPFVVYADRFQLEVRLATTLRQLSWTGWRFGDRQLRLWHQRIGMTRIQSFKEKIDALILRRKFIPAFEVSEHNIEKFISRIEKARPVLIDGYAESLNFLANYLSKSKLKINPIAVMTSAQTLPDKSRGMIEVELNCRVFDKYGSREFSGIAYECRDNPGKHHVMDESYIVEILIEGRPAEPGELGEVVITDLNNYSVPLIRYRIGDLAECVEQEICKCGRGLSLIGRIEGRTQAIVHCANGVWLPGTFFAHFFKDYELLIKQFQIFQESKGIFELRFIKGLGFTSMGIDEMLIELRKFTGDTKIILSEVTSIPLLQTGKRSPVVSTVRSDFQDL